jgi:hypothetical protein
MLILPARMDLELVQHMSESSRSDQRVVAELRFQPPEILSELVSLNGLDPEYFDTGNFFMI